MLAGLSNTIQHLLPLGLGESLLQTAGSPKTDAERFKLQVYK